MRLVLAAAAAVGLIACGSPSDLPHFNTNNIAVTDDQFGPSVDTVATNQNIIWSFPSTNVNTHNVTWLSGPVTISNSGNRAPGSPTFVVVFDTPGTYTYYCTFHGSPTFTGMIGTLVVQ